MADERLQVNLTAEVVHTIPTGIWTRVGEWEVLQSSGANVNVRVTSKGEVQLPCAGTVRRFDRDDAR